MVHTKHKRPPHRPSTAPSVGRPARRCRCGRAPSQFCPGKGAAPSSPPGKKRALRVEQRSRVRCNSRQERGGAGGQQLALAGLRGARRPAARCQCAGGSQHAGSAGGFWERPKPARSSSQAGLGSAAAGASTHSPSRCCAGGGGTCSSSVSSSGAMEASGGACPGCGMLQLAQPCAAGGRPAGGAAPDGQGARARSAWPHGGWGGSGCGGGGGAAAGSRQAACNDDIKQGKQRHLTRRGVEHTHQPASKHTKYLFSAPRALRRRARGSPAGRQRRPGGQTRQTQLRGPARVNCVSVVISFEWANTSNTAAGEWVVGGAFVWVFRAVVFRAPICQTWLQVWRGDGVAAQIRLWQHAPNATRAQHPASAALAMQRSQPGAPHPPPRRSHDSTSPQRCAVAPGRSTLFSTTTGLK